MDWSIILSSAVIATIISSGISYLISKRDSNLQYITGERKEWRESIRNIAVKLKSADYEQSMILLTELKVRINAFGISEEDYFIDSHIWRLMQDMEEEKNINNLLKLKKRLIEYLSLLLKYDWERSKEEVRGNKNRIFANLLYILIVIYIGISFIFGENFKIVGIRQGLSTYIMFVSFIIFINFNIFSFLAAKMSNAVRKIQTGKNICIVNLFVWIVSVILLYFTIFLLIGLAKMNNWLCDTDIAVCMIAYVSGISLTFLYHMDKGLVKERYVKTIDNLIKKEIQTVSQEKIK